MGGVGDPNAWRQDFNGNWFYNPRYRYLEIDEIPQEFRTNFESYRMEIDPNPDNWDQANNGQWFYYPQGTPEVQQKRLIKAREEERRRLQEGEDEIRSA